MHQFLFKGLQWNSHTSHMSPQPPQVLYRFSHLRHLWDIGLGLIHAINNNAQVLVWLVASLLSMLVVLLSLCTIVSKCLFNFIAITCSGSLLHVTCITCAALTTHVPGACCSWPQAASFSPCPHKASGAHQRTGHRGHTC